MRGLFVLVLTLCAAVSAIPYKFDHDIKVNVYDVLKSLYAAAPINSYLEYFNKDGEFKFTDNFFHFYPEEEFHDVIVVYKPAGKNYLNGYYIKVEDVSKYGDEFFDAVHPIYDYLNSGEYYAFTPLAAKKVVPDYFNAPLKKIFYDHYSDVDVHHDIPLVFLVPKSEVNPAELEDFLLIAQYEVTKDGTHDIHEYFENIKSEGKTIARRSAAYVIPAYPTVGYPYAYGYNTYPYNTYLKKFPYYYPASYVRTYPYY